MSLHGRARRISSTVYEPLRDGWEFCTSRAAAFADPIALRAATVAWLPTTVPSTAASSLRAAGLWSLDAPPRRFDAEECWYRLRFAAKTFPTTERVFLVFEGLATVADVWFNEQLVLRSENMFLAHQVEVGPQLCVQNELLIRFHSVDALLSIKRPRPRWKAPMIENQQLRWLRTTVLGRTPGWSPAGCAAAGPWREIRMERRARVDISDLRVRSIVHRDAGELILSCLISQLDPASDLNHAEVRLVRGEQTFRAPLLRNASGATFEAHLQVPEPDLWWPHTHGQPALYKLDIELRVRSADGTGEQAITLDLGHTGFRDIKIDTQDGKFEIAANGTPIFCRGACWTPLDIVSLQNDSARLQQAFDQVCAAGMNMLRVSGTMVYEDAQFLDLCDARGVLLWQDLMFASMDYPEEQTFAAAVDMELRQQLSALSARPSLAVLCGNSEVEQQAAMFGAPRELWCPDLFHKRIPAILRESCPDVCYWPSSAHGGSFPHQCSAGTTSYYGVGAYLRPIEDARRSDVRFATECLAFANVPDDLCIASMPRGAALRVHHAEWKARAPRDLGAGWDFEDVRDHYLQLLFKIDPTDLRYCDHERYLELSRVATGEAMFKAMAEWRRTASQCKGALVWFLRDLIPGAGWGVIDALGRPKAAYYYLRRILQPTTLWMTDEGLNGLRLHLANEGLKSFHGTVEFKLYRNGEIPLASATSSIAIPANGVAEMDAARLLQNFFDATYAHRFGAHPHDVAIATLKDPQQAVIAQDCYLPLGLDRVRESDLGLCAEVQLHDESRAEAVIRTRRFAQCIYLDFDGCLPVDNYFHLAPGDERRISLIRTQATGKIRGSVKAMNGLAAIPIETPRTA